MISNVTVTYRNSIQVIDRGLTFPDFELIYDDGRRITCNIFEILAYIEDMPDSLSIAVMDYIEEGFPGFSKYLEDSREDPDEEPDSEVTLQESQMSLKEFIYE